MSTKAQRAFAYVDDAAREACENGEWLVNVGSDWGDYETIEASHETRRVRGGWEIDVTVAILWDMDYAKPEVHRETVKFGLDWGAGDIQAAVSGSISDIIEADRQIDPGGDIQGALSKIRLDRLKAMFLASLAEAGRA